MEYYRKELDIKKKRNRFTAYTSVIYELVPVQKWSFYPNSSLLSKFNPRNIVYMPVVTFIARLDLE